MYFVLLILYLVFGIITLIYIFFKKSFSYWKSRGVPYLEPSFPFGNLPIYRIDFRSFMNNIYARRSALCPVFGAYFFVRPIVFATDLDFIQAILIKDFPSFNDRGVYVNEVDDPLSGHLFALDGERWKVLRAKLSPTFTSGKMKAMFPLVVAVADRFVKTLDEKLGLCIELELKDLLARFTTDVIGTCAFGIDCNSLSDRNSGFRKHGAKILDNPSLQVVRQLFVILFPNLARKLHMRIFAKDDTDFFMDSVRETVNFREKNNVKRNDFMDLLIDLKNNGSSNLDRLTFNEIAAQAFVFFLAGFETSSTNLMYTLFELALHTDIQEKARCEIENVLSRYDGELTYDAVKDMVFVDQILSGKGSYVSLKYLILK